MNTIAVAASAQVSSATPAQPLAATATIITPAATAVQSAASTMVSAAAPAATPVAVQPAPARERRQLSLTVSHYSFCSVMYVFPVCK